MAAMTKAQLLAENASLRHNAEHLEAKVNLLTDSFAAAQLRADSLKAQLEELRAAPKYVAPELTPQRVRTALVRRPIYEFDPTIPGDFARASELARTNGGITKRVGVNA